MRKVPVEQRHMRPMWMQMQQCTSSTSLISGNASFAVRCYPSGSVCHETMNNKMSCRVSEPTTAKKASTQRSCNSLTTFATQQGKQCVSNHYRCIAMQCSSAQKVCKHYLFSQLKMQSCFWSCCPLLHELHDLLQQLSYPCPVMCLT